MIDDSVYRLEDAWPVEQNGPWGSKGASAPGIWELNEPYSNRGNRLCPPHYYLNLSTPLDYTGAPEAFRTWWGHQYMVGRICAPPLVRIGLYYSGCQNLVDPIPMFPCPQACLRVYWCPHQVLKAIGTAEDENIFSD